MLRQYDQDFFKEMHQETGVDLENIVYYKDEVFLNLKKNESIYKSNTNSNFQMPMILHPDVFDHC